MSEKSSQPGGGVSVAVGTQPKPGPALSAVAQGAGAKPPAPMGQPPVAPAKPPGAFGGHVGGGKKREDGLIAGSPEAKAVDAANDALRQWIKRFRGTSAELESELPKRLQKIHVAHRGKFLAKGTEAKAALASLPPPLARPTTAGVQVAAAAPAVDMSDPDAVVGAPTGAPVVLPTFVAWTAKMLERPTKLFTRIVDRMRVGALMARVRKLALPKEIEAEAEKRMRYKDEQIADFNSALTNCAMIELNKRTVPGAQHAHWLELAMTGGELVNCHLDTVDWLEKQILARAEAEKAAQAKSN